MTQSSNHSLFQGAQFQTMANDIEQLQMKIKGLESKLNGKGGEKEPKNCKDSRNSHEVTPFKITDLE